MYYILIVFVMFYGWKTWYFTLDDICSYGRKTFKRVEKLCVARLHTYNFSPLAVKRVSMQPFHVTSCRHSGRESCLGNPMKETVIYMCCA